MVKVAVSVIERFFPCSFRLYGTILWIWSQPYLCGDLSS